MFIKLEYFNEGALILLCYMMFVYTGIVCKGEEDGTCNTKAIFTDKVPLYISLGITFIIVIGNFILLIRNSFVKIRQMMRLQKEKKRLKAIAKANVKKAALKKELKFKNKMKKAYESKNMLWVKKGTQSRLADIKEDVDDLVLESIESS